MRTKRPWNTKDYKTNRKAVLELREKVLSETLSITELVRRGLKRSQILSWEKEGKLNSIFWEGKKRYSLEVIQKLSTK